MAIKTSISEMSIGDSIICEYVASAGVLGTFSKLGTSTATNIATTSSDTPNGSFYWIYVGNDQRGRKILVADRNIQHSISWDTLNKSGLASRTGLPVSAGSVDATFNISNTNLTLRLLSGGSSSANTENEYDTYIIGKTHQSLFISGSSWSSATSTTNTSRVVRGVTGAGSYSQIASSTSTTGYGFRPALVIETITAPTTIITNPELIKKVTVFTKSYAGAFAYLQQYTSKGFTNTPFKVRRIGKVFK